MNELTPHQKSTLDLYHNALRELRVTALVAQTLLSETTRAGVELNESTFVNSLNENIKNALKETENLRHVPTEKQSGAHLDTLLSG
jgi:hypothetical protein